MTNKKTEGLRKPRPYNGRNRKGTTTTELVLSLPIFIIVTIFSLNSAAFIFAADFCDRACKDCARAAGQMSTPDDAVNAMNAAASAHPVDNVFFKQLTPQLLVYQDYNYSSTTPTPAYGKTSAYTGENGINDTTPAKDEKGVAELNDDKTKAPPHNKGKDQNDANKKEIITNIGKVIADPNQTITPGPYVTVRTTMLLHVPVVINIFGNTLFAGNVEGNPQLYQFQSIYTFPITNTYVPI